MSNGTLFEGIGTPSYLVLVCIRRKDTIELVLVMLTLIVHVSRSTVARDVEVHLRRDRQNPAIQIQNGSKEDSTFSSGCTQEVRIHI